MLSTSNTTCLLKTSATVCGTLMAAPVAGCLHGQAIRLMAIPFNGVVYHSRLDARNRSYPEIPALKNMLVGLRRSLAGLMGQNSMMFRRLLCSHSGDDSFGSNSATTCISRHA